MTDIIVEVLYQDVNDVTQQELFEVSAMSCASAEKAVVKIIHSEGGSITYIKSKIV